ncbi:Activating signal cointegrator 1 [Nymphaea thermarum]|nr:Activating signal cointegrator 1 [Nymphaea thermarum]
MMGSRGVAKVQAQQQKYRNPCLTMHQPWASLLIHGIKRIEGRSWPSPIRGRLWIHAAAKVPDPETISAMELFYREIYAVDGVSDLKFPEHYPVSRLLGMMVFWSCVNIVGCVKCEELVSWEEIPEGVRLEGQTEFCWLCEQPQVGKVRCISVLDPSQASSSVALRFGYCMYATLYTASFFPLQKLVVPFEMRGFQGIYNLEKKILEGAVRGLLQVQSPFPVRFRLPDSSDPFSLKPGSLVLHANGTEASKMNSTLNLAAAIAGARAAATQFSRNHENRGKGECKTNPVTRENEHDLAGTSTSNVESAGPMEQEKCPQVRRTRSRTDLSSPADETMFGAERGRRSTRKVNPDYSDSSYKVSF